MTRKYQAYPKYKDSGIECLGMLPSHWVVQSLSIATKRISVGLATSVTQYYRDEGIPIIRNMNIKEGYFDGSDILYLDEKFATSHSGKVVYEGDVIAVHTGSNLGLACIVPKEFDHCHTFTTLIVTTNEELLNRYLTYCINSAYGKAEIHRLKFGFGKDNLNVKEFKCFYTLIPEYSEQQQITNFLDYETAKIVTLIEKQQQLIKLLKEKRQAVISHAVTKGLNPDVKMRDSGVEWLSEVPEHWVVSKLKYLSNQIVDGAHFTPTYVDKGIPFLRVTDIQSKEINKNNIKYIPQKEHDELIKRCNPEAGDLLLSKNGTIGIPKIIDWGWEFSIFVSLCLIKPAAQLNIHYAYYFFLTNEIQEQIFGLIKQSTVVNLHLDKIESFVFTLPPLKEQKEIVEYLNSLLGIYDLQVSKAEKMNDLLRERRTALISAAVTGKIDIRDWQPPEQTNKENAA